MSAISANAAGAVGGSTGTNRFNELSSEDFLQIIFTELQQQDPFEPNDSSALLEQLNSIRAIESDIDLTKKLEDIVPSTHGTTVPNVFRSEYTLLDITDEDYLSLMDEGGETREDLKMPERPEELVKSIREGFDAGDSLILAVVKAMGEEHVMACKKDTS